MRACIKIQRIGLKRPHYIKGLRLIKSAKCERCQRPTFLRSVKMQKDISFTLKRVLDIAGLVKMKIVCFVLLMSLASASV